MSTQRPCRIDRRTAEQLLSGAPTDAPEGHPSLAALLAAAAAPGRPDELAREQAIVAAFRSAQLAPASRPRTLSVIRSAALRVLTVKAAVALAATTAGGVALAASTGELPNPLVAHPPAATSGLSAASPAAGPSAADQDGDAGATPGDPEGSSSPDGAQAPAPSLVGLCQAYAEATKVKPKADKSAIARLKPSNSATGKSSGDKILDKLLENPAFSSLVTAAGGLDKVDRFCASPPPRPVPRSATRRDTKPTDDQRGNQHTGDHTGNPWPSH